MHRIVAYSLFFLFFLAEAQTKFCCVNHAFESEFYDCFSFFKPTRNRQCFYVRWTYRTTRSHFSRYPKNSVMFSNLDWWTQQCIRKSNQISLQTSSQSNVQVYKATSVTQTPRISTDPCRGSRTNRLRHKRLLNVDPRVWIEASSHANPSAEVREQERKITPDWSTKAQRI